MLRILCIVLLAASLSGLPGVALESECAESCDDTEASMTPECQECFCCLSIRCVLPEPAIGGAGRADTPLPLSDFDDHGTAHPREISHVPRPRSR